MLFRQAPQAVCALAAMILASSASAEDSPLPDPTSLPSHPALPDALVSSAGQRVETAEAWTTQRAPELRRLFQNYEYGQFPSAVKVEATVDREDHSAIGGKATLREITLSLAQPAGAKIHLLLVVPNQRPKPAPVFLGLNFNGNQALLMDPKVSPPTGWRSRKGETLEQTRGSEYDAWAIDQSIDRGYAVATFWNGDVVPDDKDAAEAVLRQMRPADHAERGPSDTATIAAWAWCLQRAVDYLVTDPTLDAKRIALVGHSRNGKTALLAGAFDERVALIIPSQAGCGGTAPSRVAKELAEPQANGRPTVETVSRINTAFPHWFCGNFKAFNDATDKLPFDQHELIALCAPRPVLLSCATEDQWANPAGQFEMLRAADPVYRLIAKDGLGAPQAPQVDQLLPSRLGYYIRPGKHSMTRADWSVWLDYADRWLKP